MTTPSPRELANRLVDNFDRSEAVSLDRALIELLRGSGLERFKSEETAWRLEKSVLRLLQERRPEELPFRIVGEGRRLVGKARASIHDDPDIAFAKNAERLSRLILDALLDLSPNDFEVVCAASMMLSGAHEMRALCTGDEGGIDFYGRLELRQPTTCLIVPRFLNSPQSGSKTSGLPSRRERIQPAVAAAADRLYGHVRVGV